MKIFFDTEFMEDGTTIEPLSLGFVSETGQRLYVVIDDADRSKASPWVQENVLPHLPKPIRHGLATMGGPLDPLTEIRRRGDLLIIQCPRDQAGRRILAWLTEIGAVVNPRLQAKPRIEFWADFASYDWIVLCQLFGRMIDLPKGFPMFCNDIQQMKRHVGYIGKLPEVEGQAHNAMDDALNVQERYRILQEFAGSNDRHEITLSWTGEDPEDERIVNHFQIFMRRNAYLITGESLRLVIDGIDKTPRDWDDTSL